VPLRLGIDDLDRRAALASEHPGDDPAIFQHDGVDAEIAFDAAAGIEDMDQQFMLWMNRHAGQVGADSLAFAECMWHFAHCFLNTSLPAATSPLRSTSASNSWITFSRSGFGRPPAQCQQRLGSLTDLRIGMDVQCLLFVERQIGQLHGASFDGVEIGERGRGSAEQHFGRGRAGGRAQGAHAFHQLRPRLGDWLPDRADRMRVARSEVVLGVNNASDLAADFVGLRPELDQLADRVGPRLHRRDSRRPPP
jgi:hypothetical protein